MNWIAMACVISATLALVQMRLVLKANFTSRLNRLTAAACFSYAFWAFFAGLVAVAPSPEAYWAALRPAFVGYIVSHLLSVVVVVVLAGVRGGPTWVLLGPLAVLAGLEIFQAATGFWLYGAYRPTPWGNVGILPADPFWPGLNQVKAAYAGIVVLGVLGWAWHQHRSRRFRAILVQFLVLSLVTNMLTSFSIAVVWQTWGLPDLTVLAGLLSLFTISLLVSRFQLLAPLPSNLDGEQFERLKERILLVDSQGLVLQASASMAQLLGREADQVRGHLVTGLLPGWPGLSEFWLQWLANPKVVEKLEGSVGQGLFYLDLEPAWDRFGDLKNAVVTLKPRQNLEAFAHKFDLSPREKETLAYLLQGLETKDIAAALFISPETVKNHLHRVYQKTGTANRVELMRAAYEPA